MNYFRYLAKTQMFNPASIHCYIQALLKGCRCIESKSLKVVNTHRKTIISSRCF